MDGRKNELQNGHMTLVTKSKNVDRYMFVQNYRAVQVKNYYTAHSAISRQRPVTWGTIEKNYQVSRTVSPGGSGGHFFPVLGCETVNHREWS